MMIQEILDTKHYSKYRVAKLSNLPYMTLNDICKGKTRLEKCSAETVYRLAQALDVSVEDLLADYLLNRSSFDNFKSAICHRVKEKGDLGFILDTIQSGDIQRYYQRKWYPESLYLLAMVDYLSKENGIPLCDEYNDLRHAKLEKPIYPAGVLAVSAAAQNDDALRRAEKSAIPEFKQYNIIESEVRNVV